MLVMVVRTREGEEGRIGGGEGGERLEGERTDLEGEHQEDDEIRGE
jgi:hypothetical protein